MDITRTVVTTRRSVAVASLALVVAAGLVAPPTSASTATSATSGAAAGMSAAPRCPQLQRADDWYGDNAEQIQRVIDRRGTCARPHPAHRPLAVFDWDNTVIKNDISDQTLFWMLRHDKILQPPGRDWSSSSRYMTPEGAAALNEVCGPIAKPGRPLPTSTRVACTDEILSFRKEGTTTSGDPAFDGYHERQMEASYAWMAQLLQGRTAPEVRAIARKARLAALRAPVGATQRVGSSDETAWIRYYPQIRDLVRTLQRAGFDTWVVSASPQLWADVWGGAIGIDRAHTIGIRTLYRDGKVVPHLRGCGGIPDGADAIMTYIDGKRCWINKVILGIQGKPALELAPWRLRQALAGGDATTDVRMLRDATGVRVVLNRNRAELMCHAYYNADGRWAVNPMFIQPLPKYTPGYPCSTTAYTYPNGSAGPVREGGQVIPDQEDRIHG
jgi:phosphoserine phosphatase